ncbi:hypothetical protein B0A48_01582 [Cryoendolithus antarcticus]|uniref:Short-chain dehydrogenase TIC 32, chloroplastic n=1 Tax=Cryoendolithus antarcticus TaxID=1507870 RepID=A0A1V8TPW1_9PEZI|nr:hypothetical protein B0A48_01582 [Cryoendolithus antarcticus]
MPSPQNPYQPYAVVHAKANGPDDARPSPADIIRDANIGDELHGKVVLITGATSGTGLESVRAMYEGGATVFATARDIPKMDKIIEQIVSSSHVKDIPRPVAIEMHLDDLDSVRQGAKTFEEKSGGKLNILINNAGVAGVPYGQTKNGFEVHFGTNHVSHFLLFNLLKPLLIVSSKATGTTSRLVNVSSAAHRRSKIRFEDINFAKDPSAYEQFTAYGQSKLANIYMANYINRHYSSQHLIALSVHPGIVHTELGRYMGDAGWDALGGKDRFAKVFKSCVQGASTQIWAAVDPYFEDVAHGGVYLSDCGVAGPAHDGEDDSRPCYAAYAYDEEAEETLWKVSCEMVGIKVED